MFKMEGPKKKRRTSARKAGLLGHTDVGGVGTGTKGSYNEGMNNNICRLLGNGEYVLVTTDVFYLEKSIPHSVLLVKGSTITESSKFPDNEKSQVNDNDLVMIDSNAGSFLRYDNILEGITNNQFRTQYGHHDNWVKMMISINEYCGFGGGVKTFGKDFMKKEYCELYAFVDSQCPGQDGICGEFAQTVAKWFRNPSYLNFFSEKCKECADGTYVLDTKDCPGVADSVFDEFNSNIWSAGSDAKADLWSSYFESDDL